MYRSTYFDIENLRAELALGRQFGKLFKTYSGDYPEIEDGNTGALWDELNGATQDYVGRGNPMAVDRARVIAREIIGDNIKVLNVGFGSASLEAVYFKTNERKVDWSGIDISRESVRAALEKFPFAKFSVGDIRKIKSKDNHFDYVIASEVMEHIRPRHTFEALHEIHRVLKPGGMFIVSVPLNEGLENMVKEGKNPNAHVRVYSPDLLSAELEIAGFSVTKKQTLYAFNSHYRVKSLLAKYVLNKFFVPNNLVVIAQKDEYKK